MKRLACILCAAALLLAAGNAARAARPPAPREFAGFALGEPVERVKDRLQMETVLCVRHMEYLSTAETKKVEGFRIGYVTFGTCSKENRVVRVRMKYARSDRKFFDEILRLYRQRFGEPAQYRGDPFQNYIAWKWSFTSAEGRSVSLVLQHYAGDDDQFVTGNTVKLTDTTLLEGEQRCFEKTQPPEPADTATETREKALPATTPGFLPN